MYIPLLMKNILFVVLGLQCNVRNTFFYICYRIVLFTDIPVVMTAKICKYPKITHLRYTAFAVCVFDLLITSL